MSQQTRGQSLAVAWWTALALIAALLWFRRLSGEFAGPMPVGWVVLWTTTVTATSGGAWWLYRRDLPVADAPLLWRLSLLAFGVGLLASWGGAPGLTAGQTGVLMGLWGLAGLLAWSWQTGESFWIDLTSHMPAPVTSPAIVPPPLALADDEPVDEPDEDPDALQTMARRSTDEGEVIEGIVRVTFAVGEREATVHVPFCPPLAAAPTVELDDPDGHGWELKVAAAYPFGLRLQVRRGRDCADAVSGRIAYWAQSSAGSRAA
jgi:hypothetical protein